MMAPVEKLKSLDVPQHYLQPGITLQSRDAMAMASNDNAAAKQLRDAKQQRFKTLAEQNYQAA